MSIPDDLFVAPLADALQSAVQIATEAQSGDLGDAAEAAYMARMQDQLAQTGMSLDELDRLGAPQTWLGRMAERLSDWWWETFKAPNVGATDVLDAALSFPVPLLETRALQDTPYDYDEAYAHWAEAQAKIAAAISAQTDWTPVTLPALIDDSEQDGEDMDMVELVRFAWRLDGSNARLCLVEGLDEDPKIMGLSLGLALLTGKAAEALRAELGS